MLLTLLCAVETRRRGLRQTLKSGSRVCRRPWTQTARTGLICSDSCRPAGSSRPSSSRPWANILTPLWGVKHWAVDRPPAGRLDVSWSHGLHRHLRIGRARTRSGTETSRKVHVCRPRAVGAEHRAAAPASWPGSAAGRPTTTRPPSKRSVTSPCGVACTTSTSRRSVAGSACDDGQRRATAAAPTSRPARSRASSASPAAQSRAAASLASGGGGFSTAHVRRHAAAAARHRSLEGRAAAVAAPRRPAARRPRSSRTSAAAASPASRRCRRAVPPAAAPLADHVAVVGDHVPARRRRARTGPAGARRRARAGCRGSRGRRAHAGDVGAAAPATRARRRRSP